MDVRDQERDVSEESGWKLVHGDVFRSPRYLALLTAVVGIGAQLTTLVLLVIILAIVGMLYIGYVYEILIVVICLCIMLFLECLIYNCCAPSRDQRFEQISCFSYCFPKKLLRYLYHTTCKPTIPLLLVTILSEITLLYHFRRGAIVTTFIVCYALTSFISGYVSGGMYSRNGGMLYSLLLTPFFSDVTVLKIIVGDSCQVKVG